MYDIVIIGAGPAGATLARLLAEKYKILIVDKRNLSDESGFIREKCCGGLLAPAAQRALSIQGLGLPHEIMTGPQTFSVKTVDFDNDIVRYYQRHYINIDREKFDRWLVSLIPDSVTKQFSCIYKNYIEEDNYYKINIDCNGETAEIKAKILIGADGALSRVREQAFKGQRMPEKYVSIQENFTTSENLPYYVSIFDKNVTDFYSWIIQKEDRLYVGTAIPEDADVEKRYKLLIKDLKSRSLIKGEPQKRTGSIIMRPNGPWQLTLFKKGVALVGEAAGLISPSSSEGISYALLSGAIMAECINKSQTDFGIMYKRRLLKLKLNLLFKKFKVLLMYNKTTRRIIMKSKVLAMKDTGEKSTNS